MLEGLEISEITLSEALENNEVFRFDAEYFGKEALAVLARLQRHGSNTLLSIATITDGIHTSLPFVDDGDVKVLSAKHPKENFIDRSLFETISAAFHAKNPRTALREDDVLISTVGTIGNSAVVTSDLLPANSDRHIGIVRLHKGTVSPYFLSTFLLGRYGRVQTWRETTGNVQPNLFISKIGKLLLPRFSGNLEKAVTQCVGWAYQLRSQSGQNLDMAEDTLLRSLGLENWQAPEPLSYIRNSRDAFAAGRLDAQYFTPRVRALLDLLGQDGLTISDVAPPRHEKFESGKAGKSFNYIEIGDVRNDGSVESTELATTDAPSRATQYVRGGDVLTSTVRPIRRLSAFVNVLQDGAVCSSGFVVLAPNDLSASTLLTYLRLPLVCELMDLHTSASLYPAISEQDLLALPIPRISEKVQQRVDASVGAAHQAKQRSTYLLNAAKRAVEIAIEQDEKAAMAYLEANS